MDWISIISSLAAVFAGGGWFIHYRASKKKSYGEASQAEAEGWKAQQDVYQQTIADLKESCAYIRDDRNLLREENKKLREENNQLREKYNELDKKILEIQKDYERKIGELRKDLARQGRRLENIYPFTCGLAGCQNRTRVEIQEEEEEQEPQEQQNNAEE